MDSVLFVSSSKELKVDDTLRLTSDKPCFILKGIESTVMHHWAVHCCNKYVSSSKELKVSYAITYFDVSLCFILKGIESFGDPAQQVMDLLMFHPQRN